jgi:3-hydroxy-D-aspartate aldolase
MSNIYRPSIGTPVKDLETPCLIVDMDELDHNMSVISEYYSDRETKLRGHSKNHKTPAIAMRQIKAGGTVGGVCAAKVSEAEVMVHSGILNVMVTSEIIGPAKIDRLCNIADQSEIIVACETEDNARELSAAASSRGIILGVVIELETGLERCGVQTTESGVRLAEIVNALPGLSFRGLMSHQMMSEVSSNKEDRILEGKLLIQPVIELKHAIESIGIKVDIVSTGETWSYDVAGDIDGVTEVQGGTYLFMETAYSYMNDFNFAGRVLATIISVPKPGVAIGDAGVRSIGSIKGMPLVYDRPNTEVINMDIDHCVIQSDENEPLRIGDQLILIPGQQDAMVSRWDQIIGIRNTIVEVVWDVLARGAHS